MIPRGHKEIQYTCERCGIEESTIAAHVKYCPECRPEMHKERQKIAKVNGNCDWCGAEFEGKKGKLTCSDECSAERMTERIRGTRRFLDAVKITAGCVDCGYNLFAEALDFDHREDKKFNLGQAKRINKKLIDELEKCDVRCANCHRIKTKERRLEADRRSRFEDGEQLRGRSTLLYMAE